MSVWAILPIKSYERNSSLPIASLENKLLLLRQVERITTTVVMSPDPKAVSVARHYGVRTISVADLSGWETGLVRALYLAAVVGGSQVMVINPALPVFDPVFLNRLVSVEQPSFSLSLVPLGENDDTGIALVKPPDYLPISLGQGSFQRNSDAARAIHAPLTIYAPSDDPAMPHSNRHNPLAHA